MTSIIYGRLVSTSDFRPVTFTNKGAYYALVVQNSKGETILSVQTEPKIEYKFKGVAVTEEELINLLEGINTKGV